MEALCRWVPTPSAVEKRERIEMEAVSRFSGGVGQFKDPVVVEHIAAVTVISRAHQFVAHLSVGASSKLLIGNRNALGSGSEGFVKPIAQISFQLCPRSFVCDRLTHSQRAEPDVRTYFIVTSRDECFKTSTVR